ncbi:hypothetical protein Ddc_23608 [Ditylenchus destructor]|nr:hypothetical protein Ddc_23608 [Ditylenchus destructor]
MSEFKAETSSETSQARAYGLDESDDQLDSEGEQKFIPQPTPTTEFAVVFEQATQKVKEMKSLEDQLKSAEGEAEQMKAEIKNKEMEVGKIADENETLKNEIKRSRADLAAYETLYRESLETANREKEQLEKTREEQEATIEKYKIDMEACKLLVKELQTELEKCQQETMEAVNAQSDAYKTLTDILPRLAPKPEKQRFSAPGNEFTSPATPDAQKRALPESQSELPGNMSMPISQRKRPRAKTVVNEYHRNYNSKYKKEMRLKNAELETCKKQCNEFAARVRKCERDLDDLKKRHSKLRQECATLKAQNSSSGGKIRQTEKKKELTAPLEKRKRPLPKPQSEPVIPQKKRIPRAKTVISHYNLRKRIMPEPQCAGTIPGPEEKKRRRAKTVVNNR